MKAIRILLFGIGGLVALAVLALGAAVVIVDGQFVKGRLERHVLRLPLHLDAQLDFRSTL